MLHARHLAPGWHRTDYPDTETLNVAPEPNHAAGARIVFAVATAPELRVCRAAISTTAGDEGKKSHFLQTGIGPLCPERLVEQLTRLRATGLISIGTAGGLSRRVTPGTLLVPKRILLSDGMALEPDTDWHAHVCRALMPLDSINTGDLLTVNAVVRQPEHKRGLHDKTKAIAIDMESGQLAQLAKQTGIRFLALRVVMDTVDDEIPAAAAVAVNKQGDMALGPLLQYLLSHPGDLVGLIRTARRFRIAASSLHRACRLARDALLLPP